MGREDRYTPPRIRELGRAPVGSALLHGVVLEVQKLEQKVERLEREIETLHDQLRQVAS